MIWIYTFSIPLTVEFIVQNNWSSSLKHVLKPMYYSPRCLISKFPLERIMVNALLPPYIADVVERSILNPRISKCHTISTTKNKCFRSRIIKIWLDTPDCLIFSSFDWYMTGLCFSMVSSPFSSPKCPSEIPNERTKGLKSQKLQLDCRLATRTQNINLPTNQFETTVGKLSARRIQIWVIYYCKGIILKVILNTFQKNAQTTIDQSYSDSPPRIL